jgi:hypothetical protein
MRRRSVASTRLSAVSFDNGEWHALGELRAYEALLLSKRGDDQAFSDAVRVDRAPEEKLRRDEFLAFLNLAKHKEMSDPTLFRKPTRETGVDIEYRDDGRTVRLQIATAYRVAFDAEGNELPGGYQDRLLREKLTSDRLVSGFGPFERRDDKIVKNEGCEPCWQVIERSCRLGIIRAFERKVDHGDNDVSLLVKAVRYYEETAQDVGRFRTIVDAAASVVFPSRFAEVIVVDYGDRFIWARCGDGRVAA